MHNLTLAAAGLMAVTFLVHVFYGGRMFHTRVQGSTLDVGLRAISAVVWHGVSFVLALQIVWLIWLAVHPDTSTSVFLATLQAGFAALFIYYAKNLLGSVRALPHWVVFLALGGLIWAGA
ncbi:MAG: hypothetical protein ABI459_07960 [Deltaproteobacteria bacterium]